MISLQFGLFCLESGLYWQFQAKYKFESYFAYFNSLKAVYFMNFKFRDLEMQMAKFIITSAKALAHCTIVKAKYDQGAKVDEADFLRWLAAEKPKAEIYEHSE